MIGIIGAMDVEIESIKKLMVDTKVESFAHINFFSGKINNVDCVVAVCGPGKVNAAICTQLMISSYAPKLIINTGIAGSAVPEMKIGEIVLLTVSCSMTWTPRRLATRAGSSPG